jgi:hypothetical protein
LQALLRTFGVNDCTTTHPCAWRQTTTTTTTNTREWRHGLYQDTSIDRGRIGAMRARGRRRTTTEDDDEREREERS